MSPSWLICWAIAACCNSLRSSNGVLMGDVSVRQKQERGLRDVQLLDVFARQLSAATADADADIGDLMTNLFNLNEVLDSPEMGGVADEVKEKMSDYLSKLIEGLQFYDLLSQRVSHVQELMIELLNEKDKMGKSTVVSSGLEKKMRLLYSTERELILHQSVFDKDLQDQSADA